jgi:YVTN family beta-propeller protein
MTRRFAAMIAAVAVVLGGTPSHAQNAYITNFGANTVSVVATATNMVTATIPVGNNPEGVAVAPDGSHVYVVNDGDNSVSVIATATNMVTATIPVGFDPWGVAVTPDGSQVYVANAGNGTVSLSGSVRTANDADAAVWRPERS